MKRTPLLMAAVLVMAAVRCEAVDERETYAEYTVAYSAPLRWVRQRAPGQETLGILSFRQDPEGTRLRVLVEAPGGERLVLTENVRAADGLAEIQLRHDASGWWIRLDKELPARGTLAEMRRQWQASYERALASGGTVRWNLVTSGGPLLELEVPVTAGNEDASAFASALVAKSAMASLRSELPDDVARALPFLLGAEEAGSPVAPTFEDLIGILAASAAVEPDQVEPWTLEREPSPPEGFPESVPEYAELLGRFEHPASDPR